MSRYGLEWEGLSEAERGALLILAGVSDLRPFWPRVRRLAIGWFGRQFDTEGAFFGDPWAPLTPGYLAFKTRVYGSGKRILSAEGDLRRATTKPRSRSTASELVLTIDAYETTRRVQVQSVATRRRSRRRTGTGQTVEPSWFQEGTTRMPARPLIGDPPALAVAELEAEAEEYVVELARAAGLLSE